MKTKHIVLRQNRSLARDASVGAIPRAAFSAVHESSEAMASVQLEELDAREIPLLTRDADVVAVAPAMPVKLVEPVDIPAGPVSNSGISWGIRAVGADTSTFSGDGIVVAVLDTGIDAKHPAFVGVNLIQRNFTSEAPDDLHGHGTHCAGTVFGRDVSSTRIRVARGVKKALIGKVLGQGGGGSDMVANAMQWAIENGAHVLSMSLGLDFPGWAADLQAGGLPPIIATSRALQDYRANVRLFEALAHYFQTRAAFGAPTLMVAAAGNESQRDVNPDYVVAVSPPAVADGILSVGALTEGPSGLEVAPYSNAGANIVAPGTAIVSAKPGGGLATLSGTSMATPHVAGVAALWAESLRKMESFNISLWNARLAAHATRKGLSSSVKFSEAGAGLVQAPN